MEEEKTETTSEFILRFAKALRMDVEQIKLKSLSLKEDIGALEFDPKKSNKGEMLANITIAYRHLEDAKMRLGKIIQYSETAYITDVDLPSTQG